MSKVVESFEAIVKFTPQSTMRMDGDVHTVHTNETLIRPLVRCKDCKYGMTGNGISDGFVFCSKPYTERGNAMHQPDWFCADGKRKEQNDD